MKIIDGIVHVVRTMDRVDDFYLSVETRIEELQKVGLEVEVQYQQSDYVIPALILGRKEKREDGFTNER